MSDRIPWWLFATVLTGCWSSSPTEPTDCIVSFGIEPEVFAALDGVRVISKPSMIGPTALPGCVRVLAAGYGEGALAAQQWACDSRIPDALFIVDATRVPNTCSQGRAIPVLRYTRYPAHGQREEAVLNGFELWFKRNGSPRKFDTREDGELFCRVWPHKDAPMASCLIPQGKGWPGPVDSSDSLADPATAAWEFALDAWH